MHDNAICIVGVGESDDIGSTPHRSGLALQAQASRNALADAGLKNSDIDGLLTQTGGRMAPITFAEYLGLQPRFVDGTFIGGASNVAHLDMAAAVIRAGVCETVLVSYGTTPRQGEYVSLAPEYPDDFERPFGICFPVGLYAMCAQRHMYQYGTRREQFAKLVVESRKWAARNPRATRRDPVTIEDVINSPPVVSPIHRLDAHAFCRMTTCQREKEECDIDEHGCARAGAPVTWSAMPIVYRFDRRRALERSEQPPLDPAPLLSNSWCAPVRTSGGPGG